MKVESLHSKEFDLLEVSKKDEKTKKYSFR